MEVQTLILAGGVLLTFIIALVAAVFALVVYINTQVNGLREYFDTKLEAGFAELRGEIRRIGDRLYDHNMRIAKLEAKVGDNPEPQAEAETEPTQ